MSDGISDGYKADGSNEDWLKLQLGKQNLQLTDDGKRTLKELLGDKPKDESNPKDLLGILKVDMAAVPPAAIAHESLAMQDGERKYGYRNYRSKKVRARIYISACMRHLNAWLEGEEEAEDSGIHHLGHARACLGIILDAQENGTLLDDRVKGPFPETLKKLNAKIKERNASKV
jgi:hypothetical protein